MPSTSIQVGSEARQFAEADSSGKFVFPTLPEGPHSIRVRFVGYMGIQDTILVTPGMGLWARVILFRLSSPLPCDAPDIPTEAMP